MAKVDKSVTEEVTVNSITITSEGMADVMFNRKITDKANGKDIVRDVVRETVPVAELAGLLSFVENPTTEFSREKLIGK